MVWGGAPRVRVVCQGIRAGLDCGEAVASLGVGQAAAGAGEVRVERRGMLVTVVDVPAGGIRLPDLDERVPDGPPVALEHAAADEDPLAERFPCVPARQVVVERVDRVIAEGGPGA